MKTVNISTQKIRNKLRALSEEVCSFDSAWEVLYKMENWLTGIEEDSIEEEQKSHWKPSEEQMEDLEFSSRLNSVTCPNLESLYNDLKKLM